MDNDFHHQIEEKHFIEDIGLFFEQMGIPRIAGRMIGYLLIADPEAQSVTDITDALKASKSSISVSARLLVDNGLIERVASPMPRQDYYHFKPGGWIQYISQWLSLMAELHKITERGLALMNGKPEELRERLLEAHDLFSTLEEQMPALLETLEKERGDRHQDNRT